MTDVAAKLLDALAKRYRESIELVQVDALPAAAYDFDPDGWDLFAVLEKNVTRLGATEYVAIHRVSGEIQHLGMLGE
ncbi:MAG: hypothetical protein QY320_02765 [Gammaproteobacteria bacterium]|nr:MAG: hypothetical protein QY320_02765 [Gammaproteobacteria bacterium]